MNGNRFYLSSSPHFTLGNSTQKIMLTVIVALLPECIWGIVMFGLKALISILVSVLSCVVLTFVSALHKTENRNFKFIGCRNWNYAFTCLFAFSSMVAFGFRKCSEHYCCKRSFWRNRLKCV